MEISLFQDDEPLRFERIIFYPYPDLKRIWARLWLTAQQDQHPNLEIRVLNPDGSENNSISMLAQTDQRLEKTLLFGGAQQGRRGGDNGLLTAMSRRARYSLG